jgi:hypothetical protein
MLYNYVIIRRDPDEIGEQRSNLRYALRPCFYANALINKFDFENCACYQVAT